MEYFLKIEFGKIDNYVKVPKDSFFKAVDRISEIYVIHKKSLVSIMGSKAVFYQAVDNESGESWDFGFSIDQSTW